MGLEFAGVIGLLLLAPGYFVSLGMRLHSHFGFKAFAVNRLTTIIFLIVVAICMQVLVILPAYLVIVEVITDKKLWLIFKSIYVNRFFDYHGNFSYYEYYLVSLYLPFTLLWSYLLGWLIILLIEKGVLNIPFFHGAMYPLIKGWKGKKIICSVLTNINFEDSFVMYKGTLKEVSYVIGNKLNYVALTEVSIFLMKIDNNELTTTSSYRKMRNDPTLNQELARNVTYYSHATDPRLRKKLQERECFFINGEDVANILFSREILELDTLGKGDSGK